MNAQTESWTLQGPAGAIQAACDRPAGTAPARGVAILSHPHPLFGGTMDNKVVQTLARAFVQAGWTAVRYNFRGVGASAGTHDEGRGEADDLLQVIAQVAPEGPLALAGFSFGAFVTSHGAARLQPDRLPEQLVLVGTAASRFEVAPVSAELKPAPWWCMAKPTMSSPLPPCSTGPARSHFLSQLCRESAISFMDNCRC